MIGSSSIGLPIFSSLDKKTDTSRDNIRAMQRRVRSWNSVWIVYWILLSVSRSTDALEHVNPLVIIMLETSAYVASSSITILQSFTRALARLNNDRSPTLKFDPSLSITVSKVNLLTGVTSPERKTWFGCVPSRGSSECVFSSSRESILLRPEPS